MERFTVVFGSEKQSDAPEVKSKGKIVTFRRLTPFAGLGRIRRPYDLSAALGWGFFAGIWGSGKCQSQNGRAADILPFKAFTFCNHRGVNRRRRILTIVACGLVALLLVAMFSTRRKEGVPLSDIDALNTALIHEGFKVQSLGMIDEALISQIPVVKTIVSKFYPDIRKVGMNRSYTRDGSKMGIDYIMRNGEAVDISVSADAVYCARARKIVRELSDLNPNVSIWLRTNDPPIATKR